MEIILIIIAVTVSLALLFKLYLMLTAGVCCSKRSMDGMVVIITGANSGIGFETARDLAQRKAKVIMACRSLDRGHKAARAITQSTGTKVLVRYLDLSSMRSVRQFASEIIATEKKIDVLLHNAGMTPNPGLHLTEDNLELQFATNHLGPFLLTHLLLDLLKKSAPSRIVVVSSVTHLWASMDLDNLNCEKHHRDPYWIYCTTKLANILFVRELDKKLEGSGVTVNALHPGGVRTSIARNARWFIKYLIVPILYPFLKTCESGAQTSIYLTVSEDVENVSGKYFVDCKEAYTSTKARNENLAKGLWEISERLTGIKY